MRTIVATHPMISMHSDADVAEAAALMTDCSIGAIGVLGPDRCFIGIVTERDVMALVGRRKDPREVPLEAITNGLPVIVEGPITEQEALERMAAAHIRHLVIREREDFRIVSLRDVADPKHFEVRPVDLKARDVMTTPGIACGPEAYFEEIAECLVGRGISGMPVVGEDGRVLGVVSETDLTGVLDHPSMTYASRQLGDEREDDHLVPRNMRRAKNIMSSPPIVLRHDSSVEQIALVMTVEEINRVPIVDDSGRLLGIVSRGDLLGAIGGASHLVTRLPADPEVIGTQLDREADQVPRIGVKVSAIK